MGRSIGAGGDIGSMMGRSGGYGWGLLVGWAGFYWDILLLRLVYG
jgi:hypothetical protein